MRRRAVPILVWALTLSAALPATAGASIPHDLSGLLGVDVMTAFLHDYAVGHRFGWTTTPELQRAAQRVADSLPNPIDLTSFWARHRIG